MKKLFLVITIMTLFLVAGCGGSDVKKEEPKPAAAEKADMQAAPKTVKKASPVKHYTIEQFMKTLSIFGSSFSHDEKSILFTSNKSGIFNVYRIPVAGGTAEVVTTSEKESNFLSGSFPNDNRVLFSADSGGNEISHLFLKNEDGTIKDLTPEPKARAGFRGWARDQKSFFFSSNKRDKKYMDIYEMDIATMTAKVFYKNEKGYAGGSISKGKRYIAFGKTYTNHDSDIFLVDTKTGETKNITEHKGKGDIANSPLTFHPIDGKLYYLTNENSEFTYLSCYDPAAGKSEKVLQKKWGISYAYFSYNGTYRIVGTNEDGYTKIEILDTKKNQPVNFPGLPEGNITSVNISRSENLMAFYLADSRSPRNLYVYDIKKASYVQLSDAMNPEIDKNHMAKAEIIRYKSFDGLEIPAVYYKPVNLKVGQKVPALVYVHGGPGGQSRPSYNSQVQYYVNHGYVVLAVNNRGSSGYGKTFFGLDDLKHGDHDLKDCIYAKKFFESTGIVDMTQIGIMGGSYGGYMVAAALAFTPEEFAVGVNVFGVTNWLRTLKSIPPWWENFREALYKELGNPNKDEAYLRKISPLFHADKITKPLMVLQGANDPRVLKVESDEIVAAAKKNGVPVEYVVFDDEGHGFRKKKNQIEARKKILKFLDKYLKKKEETYLF